MSTVPAPMPELPEDNAPICGRVLRLGRDHIYLEVEGQLRFEVPYRMSGRARNLAGADSVLFQWDLFSKPGRASVIIYGPGPSHDGP